MVKVRDVIEVMESWAPSSLAESWDNTGLITGNPNSEVNHVIVTLDVTDKTLTLAEEHQASMVISHHPPIFKPLYNLSDNNTTVRLIKRAVKHDIVLFTAHTNLDQAQGGVSWAMAELLGLHSVSFLTHGNSQLVKFITFIPHEYTEKLLEATGSAGSGVIGEYSFCSFTSQGTGRYKTSDKANPYKGVAGKLSTTPEDRVEMIVPQPYVSQVIAAARKVHPYEEMAYDIIPLSNRQNYFGYGVVGDLKKPLTHTEFQKKVAQVFFKETLTVSVWDDRLIKRVALMGGCGSKFIENAIEAGADAFVTGELGYHDFLTYSDTILLIDASHRA
ncbi:MAG: Nif3-like dinuclear metal center hexameric protein, partial [Candidatus Latescibacteria bacterium]|nr:Nif3-like dinuclear metal center hexameric protein [Candidatus Latescibacterota bacterium]